METKIVTPFYQVLYPEFPDIILIGKSKDEELYYFDATHFVNFNKTLNKKTIDFFCEDMKNVIEIISFHYSIPFSDMVVFNQENNHILMETSLALIFKAYTDHSFFIYALEEISGMLIRGFAVSDTMAVELIKKKFTQKDLEIIFESANEEIEI